MAKARKSRRRRNPSIPRLEWVAKNYPDAIWLLTVLGFMEAAAMDDAKAIIAEEADTPVLEQKTIGEDVTYVGVLSDGVRHQIREYDAENTQYDRYIPWLAKSLNRVTKKRIKEIKKILGRAYPGMRFGGGFFAVEQFVPEVGVTQEDVDRMNAPSHIIVDAFAVFYGVIGGGLLSDALFELKYENPGAHLVAQNLVDGISVEVGSLISGFGTVARWADGAGVNLDDYEPMEAVRLAKEWARKQPKDPNIVAGDVVYEFDDGWTFQELTTRPQLMCEGTYLDHCVKGYKVRDIGKRYRIFSLRDPQGRPVATMQWALPEEFVAQFKTMSNDWPDEAAIRKGIEFHFNYIDPKLVSDKSNTLAARRVSRSDWMEGMEQASGPEKEFLYGMSLHEPWEDFPGPITPEGYRNELLEQADHYGLRYPDFDKVRGRQPNPRKRKQTPEYKRLIDRCHKLWESYDAKPLKKNLVAFGKHIERMKKSDSAKVKAEARRASRAFNKEFKARGWKK